MSVRRIDAYWSRFFGLPPEEFLAPGVQVVPHAGLGDYHGAWIFWREQTTIVSVPTELVGAATEQAASLRPGAAATPETAEALFGARVERLIGPAFQGYLEPEAFRPHHSPHVRALQPSDAAALARFAAACGGQEWEHGRLGSDPVGAIGYIEDGEVRAGCRELSWGPDVANVGVITHPACRGRGYGSAVVSALVEALLARDTLVVYQTLVENRGAVGIALGLGFREYARHLAVRFV